MGTRTDQGLTHLKLEKSTLRGGALRALRVPGRSAGEVNSSHCSHHNPSQGMLSARPSRTLQAHAHAAMSSFLGCNGFASLLTFVTTQIEACAAFVWRGMHLSKISDRRLRIFLC